MEKWTAWRSSELPVFEGIQAVARGLLEVLLLCVSVTSHTPHLCPPVGDIAPPLSFRLNSHGGSQREAPAQPSVPGTASPMGPYAQLSGGNGCCGALCHVNARVLALYAVNCVQLRGLLLERECLSAGFLTLGMGGCLCPPPCPCIPLFGRGVCGILPNQKRIQLTDVNLQSGVRHPAWPLSTPVPAAEPRRRGQKWQLS